MACGFKVNNVGAACCPPKGCAGCPCELPTCIELAIEYASYLVGEAAAPAFGSVQLNKGEGCVWEGFRRFDDWPMFFHCGNYFGPPFAYPNTPLTCMTAGTEGNRFALHWFTVRCAGGYVDLVHRMETDVLPHLRVGAIKAIRFLSATCEPLVLSDSLSMGFGGKPSVYFYFNGNQMQCGNRQAWSRVVLIEPPGVYGNACYFTTPNVQNHNYGSWPGGSRDYSGVAC